MYRWEMWASIHMGATIGVGAAMLAYGEADREMNAELGDIQGLTVYDVWMPIFEVYPEPTLLMFACMGFWWLSKKRLEAA